MRTLSGDAAEGVANGQQDVKACAINVEYVDENAAQNEGYYTLLRFCTLFVDVRSTFSVSFITV